jgi:phenylalanyl-tRNA synthetase alpha chain
MRHVLNSSSVDAVPAAAAIKRHTIAKALIREIRFSKQGLLVAGPAMLRWPQCARRGFHSAPSIDWRAFPRDDVTNVPARLEREWYGRRLLQEPDHPLARAKTRVVQQLGIECFENLQPVVSLYDNFDSLLIPATHVSRSPNDTYYVNRGHVLRTHTSAHQRQLLLSGPASWLVCGDVFRRDEIDASHFPVFHQMDGGRVFPLGVSAREAEEDLKGTLEGLMQKLFGAATQLRWRDDSFPFTKPSFELDVMFNGEWLEILGCGLIHEQIVHDTPNIRGRNGWAFGIGLERLAMVLYGVKDIRAFWSRDDRFWKQFRGLPLEAPIAFEEFSKFPKTSRDVSFWTNGEAFHENQFFELVREVCGDLVEAVVRVDTFRHPKYARSVRSFFFVYFFSPPRTGRSSHTFRVDYRSMERTLDSAEVNRLQEQLRSQTVSLLNVELR